MDAREHAYRVLAIIERQRMEVGGTASDGGPGCAPVRRGEQRLAAERGWDAAPRREALAPALQRVASTW
jgi:hypothetical protein